MRSSCCLKLSGKDVEHTVVGDMVRKFADDELIVNSESVCGFLRALS